MLKENLLPIIQEEATRLGLKPLTDRRWEDWLDERLIEGPKPRGRERGSHPLWDYPHGTLQRALDILQLKSKGSNRFPLLRIHLWLKGYEIPPEKLARDLKIEFARLLKRRLFRQPWTYDANDKDAETSRKRQKRKLAEVDAAIASFKPSDDLILEIGSILSWASEKFAIPDLINSELSTMTGLPREKFVEIFRPLQGYMVAISGLFGNPDEIEKSGLSQLETVDIHDLVAGRKLYRFLTGLFDLMALIPSSFTANITKEPIDAERVARSLRTAEWTVAIFGMAVVIIARKRTSKL